MSPQRAYFPQSFADIPFKTARPDNWFQQTGIPFSALRTPFEGSAAQKQAHFKGNPQKRLQPERPRKFASRRAGELR